MNVGKQYWQLSAQRSFLDNLAKKLHISRPEDWYKVTSTTLKQYGATGLLKKYNYSPSKLLINVYPEYLLHISTISHSDNLVKYNWDIFNFTQLPSGYWNDISNQRSFLEGLAKKLHIDTKDDWYKITQATLNQHGGSGLLKKYNFSLSKLLTRVFPEYHERDVIFHFADTNGI